MGFMELTTFQGGVRIMDIFNGLGGTMFHIRANLLVPLLRLLKSIADLRGTAHMGRRGTKGRAREVVCPQVSEETRRNMFCFWNYQGDQARAHFSNNNYHPKCHGLWKNWFSLDGGGPQTGASCGGGTPLGKGVDCVLKGPVRTPLAIAE